MEDLAGQTPRQPKVAVAVLNWHGREQTRACLEALRALEYPNLTVILVDNGCEDFRDETFPPPLAICYEHSPENLGFAGGSNLALERALASESDFIWFLNNDAAPEPKEFVPIPGAGHNDTVQIGGREYFARIARFLDERAPLAAVPSPAR